MTDKTCRQCGKTVPRTRASFCNQACEAAFHGRPAGGSTAYIPGKTCQKCGGPIPWRDGPENRDKARFCSRPCSQAYQKTHPPRARKERTTVPCATCGDPVSFLPSQRGSYREGRSDNIYCSRKCKGIGHSQLMTGRRPSNGIYTSPSTFRTMVRQEFHDRCALCGWDETPCDIAHIESRKDGGYDALENVTMLCPNHHRKFDMGLIPVELIRATRVNVLKHQPSPP